MQLKHVFHGQSLLWKTQDAVTSAVLKPIIINNLADFVTALPTKRLWCSLCTHLFGGLVEGVREWERKCCVYYVICYAVLFITNHRACVVRLLLGRTHFKGHLLCFRLLKWCDRLTALGLLHFRTAPLNRYCTDFCCEFNVRFILLFRPNKNLNVNRSSGFCILGSPCIFTSDRVKKCEMWKQISFFKELFLIVCMIYFDTEKRWIHLKDTFSSIVSCKIFV